MKKKTSFFHRFALVGLLLATMTMSAQAELNESIDLTLSHGLRLQRQTDGRWAPFAVGPYVAQPNINMGRCGCFLTSLSTALGLVGGSLPWFPTYLYYPNEAGFIGPQYTLNPEYVQEYLSIHPIDRSAPLNWGFVAPNGVGCGVQLKPSAADFIANPLRSGGVAYTETGLTWDTLGWNSYAKEQVDKALQSGWPSIVTRKSAGGSHANLIVGWDNTEKRYLIYDPMWSTEFFGEPGFRGGGVNPMGYQFTGATPAEQYTNYQAAIENVKPLRPVYEEAKSRWLTIFDDPEPIELRLIDPRGRITGNDPASGKNLQENPSAFYSEFTSWADPLGQLPEAAPTRYIAARNPEPGVYGLEVFGTGNAPFSLTFGTIDGDRQQNVVTVTGNITSGEIKRYEIEQSPAGTITVVPVAAFGPHARAGNDVSRYVNTAVSFDGRGSSQINGTITGYSWSFGDGSTGSGAQQSHAYTAPGSYLATLTVTNAAGLTNTDERTVVIVVPGSAALKETILVSVTATNAQGNDGSGEAPQITPDGRYVAFESFATNLVADDTNTVVDIFVKDLSTGSIERVSVATDGAQANNYSRSPAISPDGRFVSFFSAATNLGGSGGSLFVHDRVTGTTETVALTGQSVEPASFSADGRYIAFSSNEKLLPAGYGGDIYVRDRQLATLELVSTYSGQDAHISADGRFVTYSAGYGPDNLDSNSNRAGVYVRDRQTGTDELISRSASGSQISNNSFNPSISADGRFVAFEVNALSADLNTGHPTARPDVFLRDRLLGTTEQINLGFADTGASFQPAIGPSGRYVAFLSAPDLNLSTPVQIYIRDRQAGTTEMVSVSNEGTASSFGVGQQTLFSGPSVTTDGGVVFRTNDPNLVADDTNGRSDVFLRRLVPGSGTGSTTPLANLGGPYLGWASSAAVPTGVRLDGSSSVDPNSRPLNGHWNFGDGSPVADGALVMTHAYAKPGIYQVTLTVNAGTDTSLAARTEVEVLPALPANALSVGACVAPGGALSIEGAAPAVNAALLANGWDTSTGPLQTAPVTLTFPWGQIQLPTTLPGLTFQGTVTVPTATINGNHEVVVTNGSSKLFKIPCSTSSNLPPLAVAGGPIYHVQAGAPLMLNGSSSSDPENAPLSYDWDFGDLTSGATVTPTHTYSVAGSYFVTLVVNDGVQNSETMMGTRSFAMVEVSPPPTTSTVQFDAPTYVGLEDCVEIAVTVTRTGNTTTAATVDYATADGTANERADYTTALGTLRFAANETTKTFVVLISEDSRTEGNEFFTVTLSNPTGGATVGAQGSAAVQITDDPSEPSTNAIDENSNFVAQHYHDFLNRQHDPAGFGFWMNELTLCGADVECLEFRRQSVSAAFFLSIEFQRTGYEMICIYKATFTDSSARPRGLPRYREFLKDTQEVRRGVAVGVGDWEQQLQANTLNHARQWVQRAEVLSVFPDTMTAEQFVDKLFLNSEVVPTSVERTTAIAAFGAGGVEGRSQSLLSVTRSGSVYNRQFNSAFVLMQYFGYLRRNPNDSPDLNYAGFDFWLDKLNQFTLPSEDARDEVVARVRVFKAEMVKAFIVSSEYRARFH